MFKAVYKLIFFVSLLCTNVFADSCKVKPEALATEFVKLQLFGHHFPDRSKCLENNDLKLIHSDYEPSEKSKESFTKIPRSADIKIVKIENSDAEHDEYKALFSISWKNKSGKPEAISDSLMFLINTDERAQKISGCANLLDSPKRNFIYEGCE